MIVFTDRSAQSNPGPTGSGVITKKQGQNSTPIKIAKTVKCMGSSYEGELQAIKIATEYPGENLSPSNNSIHTFSVTSQNRENYHNSTVTAIYENLMDIICTPFPFCWVGRELNLQPNFQKGGDLTGPQL